MRRIIVADCIARQSGCLTRMQEAGCMRSGGFGRSMQSIPAMSSFGYLG